MHVGTYKPRMRCYELDQMSMKFERYLAAEGEAVMLGGDFQAAMSGH